MITGLGFHIGRPDIMWGGHEETEVAIEQCGAKLGLFL